MPGFLNEPALGVAAPALPADGAQNGNAGFPRLGTGQIEAVAAVPGGPERERLIRRQDVPLTRAGAIDGNDRVVGSLDQRERGLGSTLRGASEIGPPVVLEEGRQGDGSGVGI